MKRTVTFTAVAATMALMGQMAAPALADDDRKLEAVPYDPASGRGLRRGGRKQDRYGGMGEGDGPTPHRRSQQERPSFRPPALEERPDARLLRGGGEHQRGEGDDGLRDL